MKYRPEYDPKIIGENLKRLREAKDYSVKEVQEYLRLGSPQAVYKYESGRGYPQADTMFALMELYEADLRDITCKYEPNIYSNNEENFEPSSVIFGYHIPGYESDAEICDFETYRNNQKIHLLRYIELYKAYLEKSIAS